jgi:acyl-coenzyme A thioesterase PaaI-like protein
MDIVTLQKTLDEIAAEYVRRLNLRVESIDAGADSVNLSLPVTPELVHAGGVLCGQAIMSAADTAMLLAMIAQLGEFRPMTTVQLQTSFLRPVPREVEKVGVIA